MLPIFAQLNKLYIYTYGVFLLLGFFWACFFVWKHIRISKFEEETSFDMVFMSFGGALLVGRILYGVFHFSEFGFNILKYILVNGYPGISPFGMIIGGVGTMYIVCQQKKIKFQEFSDYIIPSIFIFTLAAEVGAFIAGTEPGITYKWFRHPVALYKALILGIGSYTSIKMFYNVRKEKVEKGALLFFFFGIYSLTYVAFQFLKDKRALLTESPNEYYLFLILLLTSCFYFVYYFRVLMISSIKSFINSIRNYGKQTVKNISSKTKSSDRGGTEKTTSSN
jgi:prolipoprotein diacylglyceryltransferase